MELLSPAGSFDALKAAVSGGCDAVYFGAPGFNARRKSDRETDLEKWIEYSKIRNVKAYAALNILIKERELSDALSVALDCYRMGADALIVQDVGLIAKLNEAYPQIPIHVSTQCGIYSADAAKDILKFQNVHRIVLPRECDFTAVKTLSRLTETEVFCHGALCAAFSGNCLMSSILTGESGNRGLCRQMCRMKYTSNTQDGYLLSTKDLCLIGELPAYREAGVSSLKIEGRLKRPEYVYSVTKLYRKALDGETINAQDMDELKLAFNRGNFTRGYAFSTDIMDKNVQSSIGIPVGSVAEVSAHTIKIKANYSLAQGDGFKILSHKKEKGSALFQKEISTNTYLLNLSGNADVGDKVHLISRKNAFFYPEKKQRLPLSFCGKEGERAILSADYQGKRYQVYSAEPLAFAQKQAISEDSVKKQLSKFGDTPFVPQVSVQLEPNLFLPVSELNRMRRDLVNLILQNITESIKHTVQEISHTRNHCSITAEPYRKPPDRQNCYIINDLRYFPMLRGDIVLNPFSLEESELIQYRDYAKESYLYLPYYLSKKSIDYTRAFIKYFKGVYCNNLFGIQAAIDENKQVFAGSGLNIANAFSLQYFKSRSQKTALSYELNLREIDALQDNDVYVNVYGDMPLMQLNACPFQNVQGATCKCSERFLKITDSFNQTYVIVKQNFGDCVFTLYNAHALNALSIPGVDRYHAIYNFSLYDGQDIELFLSGKRQAVYTKGHFLRGVK